MVELSVKGAHPTVSSAYVRAIYNAANTVGIDPLRLQAVLGDDLTNLEIGTRRYPAEVLFELFELAATHLNSPAIGVAFGSQIRAERRLDVIYATSFCQTLREAIELNIAYQPLIQTIGKTSLEIKGDLGRCVWSTSTPQRPGLNIFKEAVFTSYASVGSWLVWADALPIKQVMFSHDAPANTEPYIKAFGPNVVFSAAEDALIFELATLEMPIPSCNAEILARLKTNLNKKLQAVDEPQDIIADTAAVITAQLNSGAPSINLVCEKMGMKERTLRRKLREKDTGFSELLAQVRREAATIYMMDKNMSLAEIAQAVGFNDQSAFSRAFKKWSGKTPKAYRDGFPF